MTQTEYSKPHTISIAGTDVQQILYKGAPVVTFAMVDAIHQRPDGTAGRTFRDNRERFVEGEDIVTMDQADEIRRLGFTRPQGGTPAFVVLITRRGYLKLVKPLSDDRAWEVQGEMIDRYFAVESPPIAAAIPTTAEAFAHAFTMIADAQKQQAVHSRAIERLEEKVDRVETAQTVLRSRPANAEGITHIRPRINRMFGLSSAVVDEVMRQSPYAPKPAGMVRNDHVDADGALYAVYWQKDVTKTFERFVDECRAVTAFMFTHPFIEGRFRVARKLVVA